MNAHRFSCFFKLNIFHPEPLFTVPSKQDQLFMESNMEDKLAAAPVRLALEVALFTKIEAET